MKPEIVKDQTLLTEDQFRTQGYAVKDGFLTPQQCQELLQLIAEYRQTHTIPEIYRQIRGRSLHYKVIDGEQIEQHLPPIWQLYHQVNELANRLSGQTLAPLSNKKVGVNINIVPIGGEYRWHYDRNALTAILYLNQVEGGDTEFYPNYRLYLRQKKHTRWQQYLDKILSLTWVRRLFGKKVSVSPLPGTLVIIPGDRCLHSVQRVEGNQERVNIILAYDQPGANFPAEKTLDRYLYTQDQAVPADPNYV